MKVEAHTITDGYTRTKEIELIFSNQDSVTMSMDRARQLARDLFWLTNEVEPQPGTVDALRSFASDAIEMRNNGIDGLDIQELAVKHGLLIPSVVHKSCGDHCRCEWMANDIAKGVTCFRLADVMLAPVGEVKGEGKGEG